MSKKEEILHKLSTEDRNYIKEKFKEQDQNQTAIDKPEQLKHDIWTNQHDDGWLDKEVDIYELTEMIDQKIKALKGDADVY